LMMKTSWSSSSSHSPRSQSASRTSTRQQSASWRYLGSERPTLLPRPGR
jgi:hypothetical protein